MKIADIFTSLQGEGKNQGRPCLFIRLAGCNLNCRWCDTPESRTGGREMSVRDLLDSVQNSGQSHLCITGGEPLLQAEDLMCLLSSLHERGFLVDIETNGTIDFITLQPYASICMDVKCPSSGEQSNLSLLGNIRPHDSVKFVVKDEVDCRYARDIIRTHTIEGEIFFSPVFGTDYRAIADFILNNRLPVRMQVQLHKILGVQ